MTQSSTASLLENIALFGNTPADVLMTYDAPSFDDAQPLIERMMDALITLCQDTCSELDSQDMLWNMVNVFHSKAFKLEREIDVAMQSIQTLSTQQDGSEIASGQLEEATQTAYGLQNRLQGAETLREAAAQYFEEMTGSVWQAKRGSRKPQGTMTAGMYDAKQIMQTRQRQKNEINMPEGEKIIIAGDACHDHNRLYAYLDNLKAKYDEQNKQMVLLHGGQDKGVDCIAASWAKNRNVHQVAFKPEWKDGKAAPFKRNDKMLEELPSKVVILNAQSGVTLNLRDKAKKMGIVVSELNEGLQNAKAA